MGNNNRSGWSALMVRPKTHLLLASAIIGLVVISSAISVLVCVNFLTQVLDVVTQANTLTAETKGMLDGMYRDLFIILVVMAVIISLIVAVILGFFVSRLTGAQFAINRHIEEKLLLGELSPVKLRRTDFLQDIADNLNKFIEKVKSSG